MVVHTPQVEVAGVEVDESVEEDVGGVGPQLLTLPQVLLLHATHDLTCRHHITSHTPGKHT